MRRRRRSRRPACMSAEATAALRAELERFSGPVPAGEEAAAREAFLPLKAALNAGTGRAAGRGAPGPQSGRWVPLPAAAQIGGVLEPAGALPVIIEDEVLVGGNCGVYEGTIVGRRAVLGAGVILTGGITVYDV